MSAPSDDQPSPSGADRYTFISADNHAGATPSEYREYLDPAFRDDFDAWRGRRSTDDERRRAQESIARADPARNERQEADGVVGEVIYPDGDPPFFPSNVFLSGPPRPDDYALRRAGVHALNRWMADFCAPFPKRRAGVGALLLNDLDDAVADTEWIAAHGLRGGVQIPNITPDVDWIPSLIDRRYDRLWALCQDLGIVVAMHLETGFPHLGADPLDLVAVISEGPYYVIRPLMAMVTSGVFERFPDLRVALSEQPIGVLAGLTDHLDAVYAVMRATGAYGTLALDPSVMLAKLPSEYLRSNVWFTASPPLVSDLEPVGRLFGFDHLMVGNDFPHSEGTAPFTLQTLRQVFHGWEPVAVQRALGDTAASLYGFDLDALASDAARYGPTVAEVSQQLSELPDDPNYILVANARANS